MVPAIILTLAGLVAGALAMWPMFGPASAKISAAVLGVALAVYLWVHAGVRDHPRLTAVVVAAIVGDVVIAFVGVIGLLLTWLLSNGSTPTPFVATAAAGAVGAAVIAVVFLLVLPSTGEHLLLEVVFSATVGALSVLLRCSAVGSPHQALAGPIVQVPLWHVAVASSLAVVASLRLRPVATNPFALRYLAGVGVAGRLRLAHGQRRNYARRGTACPRRRRVLTVCRRHSRGENQVRERRATLGRSGRHRAERRREDVRAAHGRHRMLSAAGPADSARDEAGRNAFR